MQPTERFTTRAGDYAKFRPTYPAAIVTDLQRDGVLRPDSIVADIGSGTGLLARLFLDNGNSVIGVEPNAAMRAEGDRDLADYPKFRSLSGAAEATGLPDAGVDLIIAGQAFHWFDRVRARPEFSRILRPPRWVVLVWNDRQRDSSPFASAYEHLVETYSLDYHKVNHRRVNDDAIAAFYHPGSFTLKRYLHPQTLTLEQVKGRLTSSSYAPAPGHERYEPMVRELESIFAQHQRNGGVSFNYETRAYIGQLDAHIT